MQLSEKQKTFSIIFTAFLKCRLNFNILKQKMPLIDFEFPKLRTPTTWSDKFLKSPILEDPSTRNMVDVPKHC